MTLWYQRWQPKFIKVDQRFGSNSHQSVLLFCVIGWKSIFTDVLVEIRDYDYARNRDCENQWWWSGDDDDDNNDDRSFTVLPLPPFKILSKANKIEKWTIRNNYIIFCWLLYFAICATTFLKLKLCFKLNLKLERLSFRFLELVARRLWLSKNIEAQKYVS